MNKKTILGIVGFLMGLPLSYFFQPEKLRAVYSVTDYLGSLPDLLSSDKGDFASPIIITCIITTAIGILIGYFLDQAEEQQLSHSKHIQNKQSKFCSNCGAQMNPNFNGDFCDQCGSKL